MESGATCGSVIGRSKKGIKTRRSWTTWEEELLIQNLKEVIAKGWKSENGFKAGCLNLLEAAMKEVVPSRDLLGSPNINSKMHVWKKKKTYNTLVTILRKSGIGWNDIDCTIEATEETWDSLIKSDPIIRTMRHKQWPYYNDRCEIFGNDRATGDSEKNFNQVLQNVLKLDKAVAYESLITDNLPYPLVQVATESISDTHMLASKPICGATSRNRKRKEIDDMDESIVEAIKILANITKDTMADLTKQLTVEEKITDAQDVVLAGLQEMHELSGDEQVRASRLLFHNYDELALFKHLGEKGRICLDRRLLSGLQIQEMLVT